MAKAEDAQLTKFKELHAKAKTARKSLERDWYMNLAYYMGDQWVMWNQGRIERPKLENWRIEFTDNRIMPAVVSRVARATKVRPTFICVPDTTEDDDMSATEAGEKLLEDDWDSLSLDHKHLLAEFWKDICSAGFWKVMWDSTAGEKIQVLYGPDNQALRTPNGAPIKVESQEGQEALALAQKVGAEGKIAPKDIAEGFARVEVISPFELFPDPLAETIDDCEWIIEEKIRSKQYVEKMYGVENVIEDEDVAVGIAEARMAGFGKSGSNTKGRARGVKVCEIFIRPCKEYPNGYNCVWFNDEIHAKRTADESPYGEFPYVMFHSNIVPGRFWPRAVVSDMRAPQTDLNKIQSQIRENAMRIGNPPIAISREANVEWDGRPGGKVYFSDVVQNALPQPIQMPEVPGYVRQEVERIETSLMEISGLHDISQGKVPTGVTAASAINLLQESDDSRLGPEIQLMEKTIAKAGQYLLEIHTKFDSLQRTVRLLGADSNWDIETYSPDVFKRIKNVIVEAGSGMPQSKAARQAAMQELLNMALQYGVPLNQRAMRKFFKDYELGGLDKLFQDIENDESQIVREHRHMYAMKDNAETLPINIQDDDDIHIEGHKEEMKTAKYEKEDNIVKAAFIAHLKLHMQRKQMAVEGQVRAQQMEAIAGAESQRSREQEEDAVKLQQERMKQQGTE